MKLALMLWLSWCSAAWGSQSVTLGWNAGPVSSVSGYVLYYGAASRAYTNRTDVGTNIQATITGLKEGVTYYFALTAYNAARTESLPSAEIVYIVPGILTLVPGANAGSPLNIEFPVAPGSTYSVQASGDLKTWSNIWQTATATSNTWVGYQDAQSGAFPKRFYRLLINSNAPTGPPPAPPLQLSIANQVTVPSLTAGQWQLSAPALSGTTYLLEYSTNLSNWTYLRTNQAGQALSFVDTPPSSQPWRFYRSLIVTGNVTGTNITNAMTSNSYLTNVVGFVNVSAPPGFSLIANPFNTTNNTLAALLPAMPNGTRLAKYVIGFGYVTNLFSGGSWNVGTTTLNPGEGGFFGNPATTNLPLTFSGQVWLGTVTNSLAAGTSIISPMIPLGNALSTFPAGGGDTISCYVKGVLTSYPYQSGVWYHTSSIPGLSFIPGAAYLLNKSSATNWIESFQVGD